MTPRIGVTGIVRQWDGASRTGVNAAYVESVMRAGGVPIVLSPLIGAAHAAAAIDGLDGLLFTGGEDIDPSLYGAEPSPRLGTVDRNRDLFELATLAAARERRMPVLGICRGIQLINVACEGTLWQDLPSERPEGVDHNPKTPRNRQSHGIRVAPGTRAAAALGRTEFAANSFHHQAVRVLGAGLVATAWAGDDLIEAVEGAAEDWWLLAVQWHPEEMSADAAAPHGGIFRALVAEAARYAGSVGAEVPENAIG